MAKKDQNSVSVTMREKKRTSGAVQYVELDESGDPIPNPTAGKFGGIYVRKTLFGNEPIPNEITVSASW